MKPLKSSVVITHSSLEEKKKTLNKTRSWEFKIVLQQDSQLSTAGWYDLNTSSRKRGREKRKKRRKRKSQNVSVREKKGLRERERRE